MKTLKYLTPNSENSSVWITAVLMILGVFVLGWRPEIIIFSYIFETIIIGIIHIFKMLAVVFYSEKEILEKKSQNPNEISGIFAIIFFCFHYFFFIAIQSVFVFVFVGMNSSQYSSDFTGIFKNFAYLFSQSDMREAFSLIVVSNIVYSLKSFFIPKNIWTPL